MLTCTTRYLLQSCGSRGKWGAAETLVESPSRPTHLLGNLDIQAVLGLFSRAGSSFPNCWILTPTALTH